MSEEAVFINAQLGREVVELICSVLRSGFSESEPGPFVLPPQSVAQYLTNQNLQTPRVGLLVKTACSFVSSLEHDGLDHQQDMLNSVLLWVIGLLKQLPSKFCHQRLVLT